MNDERWRRVEEICHDALERPGHERAEFIHNACAGDDALHAEVASLLANAAGAADSRLGIRDSGLGIRTVDLIGTQLGVYRIGSLLGVGGMGEVYRARDTKLERDVAIKVLPAAFTADPDRLARFQREARVLASLNHPHIGAIYGFEESSGASFLVLELVEGPTLAERIAGAPFATAEALKIAREIADALDAAHEKGIVHRDLKPANIKLTPNGRVKVLDFGIAKLVPATDVSATLATTTIATREGAIVGTPAYMSPEQARGLAVDKRTDIWAFGCVLYEMLTRRHAFPGDTVSDRIAAIIERQPDWSTLPPATPEPVRRLLVRCLEKDPKRRLHDIADARIDIDETLSGAPRPALSHHRTHRRKWMARAAAMVGVVMLGVGWWATEKPPTRPSRIESLVVLPFQNLSGDLGQDYFVEGMTDAIMTDLAKISGLKVISRTSAMRYKNSKKRFGDIVRELGVEAVVEGSVLRVGDRVRITAQLIEGSTDTHLWADSYERDLDDVLLLQRDLAHAIAREIRFSLKPETEDRPSQNVRLNREAYDAYLLGRHHVNQRTREGLERAVMHFERAIAQDPTFAPAYAGLADTYVLMEVYSGSAPANVHPKAKAAALRALDLDPRLGEAYSALAWISFTFDFDWAAAEKGFQQAIRLSPGYATAHHWYAIYLSAMGRFEPGKVEMRRALQLDPLSPIILSQSAFPFFFAGENDNAIAAYRKALEIVPDFRNPHTGLARSFIVSGAYEDAIAEIGLGQPLRNEGLLGMAYGFLGRTKEAHQVLERLAIRSRETHVPAIDFGLVHIGLRDNKRALDWLERAYEERGVFVAWLKTWPLYDPLREEPRFKKLLERMQFPD